MPTRIEWTDETWNPVVGCSHVSPGCDHCYAEAMALRFQWTPKPWTAANAAGNVRLHPERLTIPLRSRKARRIFVCSTSDLFHPVVVDMRRPFLDRIVAVMALTARHTYQLLTKRPERARAYLADPETRQRVAQYLHLGTILDTPGTIAVGGSEMARWRQNGVPWPLPNLWLGVTAEDQRRFDERWEILRQVPAAVRFVSIEPMLGPVDIREGLLSRIEGNRIDDRAALDWVIVGGESGGPVWRMLIEVCGCRYHQLELDDDREVLIDGQPEPIEIKPWRGYGHLRLNSGWPDCPECEGRGIRPTEDAVTWVRSVRDQCLGANVPFFFKGWGGRTQGFGGATLDGRERKEFPEVRR